MNTCEMKKTTIELYPDIYKGGYNCRIITDGVVVAEAWGKRPRDAKKAASDATRYNAEVRDE